MKTTPTSKDIIQIMKNACEALEQFNKEYPKINFSSKIDYDLELWSSNLRFHASSLNNRIINK
jgi:hypothetical protein